MSRCLTYIFLAGFLTTVFCACKIKQLQPHEYVQWMNAPENGLRVKKSLGGFDFTLQYKSPEYVALQENKSDAADPKAVQEKCRELEGMQYYTFFIQSQDGEELLKAGIQQESEYYSRLEYFVSPAQDNMMLVENGDTLPCLLYHYERNYGLSPMTAIVLGFEEGKNTATADRQFIYDDQVLSTGPVQLTIKASDIQQIPSIRYVHP